MTLRGSLISRDVLPFFLALLALLAAALAADAILHLLNLVHVGTWLGITGVLLVCGSFGYSLRKRGLIRAGRPVRLLRLHEFMAWAGSLLILVHAGIHFNAVLAWLAVGAMLLNVASGLTGKFLLRRAGAHLAATAQRLRDEGLSPAAEADRLHWDSLTYDTLRQWRVVHTPVALAFAVLATAHVISSVIFWGWS